MSEDPAKYDPELSDVHISGYAYDHQKYSCKNILSADAILQIHYIKLTRILI